MDKNGTSRTPSPYDLNASLKSQKPAAAPQIKTREQSPYTLSHKTSLQASGQKSD